MNTYRNWLIFALTALLVAACGGGGSSSSSNQPPGAQATGGLTLLVGDAPDDEFDAILLTIDNVILIGDGGQRDLDLESPVEVDLLQLSKLTDLVLDTEVPVGTYSKIRLEISGLELQTLNDAGEVLTSDQPPLPANGKIDLNPRGNFSVRSDRDLVIVIDMDVNRSLKVTSTGSGEYRFRPVVFVDIEDQPEDSRLVRLEGQIANFDDPVIAAFDLCDDNADEDCIPVNLTEPALLVDANGTVIDLGSLANDTRVTLFGHFTGTDEFNASVLTLASADDLTKREGEVSAEPDAGSFELSSEGVLQTIALLENTLLLGDDNQAVSSAALLLGTELEAWTISPPSGDPIALVIQLDEEEASDEQELEGMFLSYQAGQFELRSEAQTDFCVRVDGDTVFVQFTEESEATETVEFDLEAFEQRLQDGDYENLALEVEAEVTGPLNDGCYDADMIVLELEE